MMMESNQKDERAEQERKETEGDRIGRPSTFKLQKRTAVVVVLSLSWGGRISKESLPRREMDVDAEKSR